MSHDLMRRRSLTALLFVAGLSTLAVIGSMPGHAADRTVRVGIMSGEDEDVWRIVAKHAAPDGLQVKVVTFSDYTQPNEALSEHEIDANSFQHGPYLKAQIEARGYKIVPVGWTYVAPIGLYSLKHASVAELPQGSRIGVPNDPSNEGRALLLLQAHGLIRLRDGVGLLPTAADITDNPKSIQVVELDAGIVGRAIDDLDAAVVNTDWARKAGIKIPDQRIAQERVDGNPYRNFIAVEAGQEDQPWVKSLVSAYHADNVRDEILAVYKGSILPAW